MIIITWCISLPTGLVEHLNRDDPATIQHLENKTNTFSASLRSKSVDMESTSLEFASVHHY